MLPIFEKLGRRRSSACAGSLTVGRDIRVTAREDGVVFLNTANGAIFSANATGAAIWERLRRGESPEEAGAALAPQFEIPAALAARDAVRFAARLEAEGILVRSRAA